CGCRCPKYTTTVSSTTPAAKRTLARWSSPSGGRRKTGTRDGRGGSTGRGAHVDTGKTSGHQAGSPTPQGGVDVGHVRAAESRRRGGYRYSDRNDLRHLGRVGAPPGCHADAYGAS